MNICELGYGFVIPSLCVNHHSMVINVDFFEFRNNIQIGVMNVPLQKMGKVKTKSQSIYTKQSFADVNQGNVVLFIPTSNIPMILPIEFDRWKVRHMKPRRAWIAQLGNLFRFKVACRFKLIYPTPLVQTSCPSLTQFSSHVTRVRKARFELGQTGIYSICNLRRKIDFSNNLKTSNGLAPCYGKTVVKRIKCIDKML